MKKVMVGLSVFIASIVSSQEAIQVQKLSKPQVFYIASRTNLSGGKSRICKYIKLPESTVKWGFSISTDKSKGSQTVTKNLNFLSQTVSDLDLKINQTKEITVPQGDSFIQTFVVNKENRDLFLSQNTISDWSISNPVKDLHYLGEGLLDQVKQGVVFITEETQGSWYLCMRNPDKLYGVNASVETVAYVRTKKPMETLNEDTLTTRVDELSVLRTRSIDYWVKKSYKKAKATYKEYESKGGDKLLYKNDLEEAIQVHQIGSDKKIKRFIERYK